MHAPADRRTAAPSAAGSFLFLFLALLPLSAQAQATLTGRIIDGEGAPVALANVQLRAHADSSLVRAVASDARGNFVIEAPPGTYRLLVSRIGFRSTASEVLTLAGSGRLQAAPLVLQAEAIALEQVVARAGKALYQQRADRLIINIESSPGLSGASALQVLERSPGVVVDRMSNAVSMIGKAGVRVLINGRLSYLPADGLVQYLAGMSADNLERIELITSPPASLDAEGNAGYINLVMKRNPNDGLNGSLTLSGGYGEGELGNAGTTLHYRRSRIDLFGTYSFLWNAQKQYLSNYRRVVGSDDITEMPGATWRDPVQRNHDVRMGIDYRVNGSTTIGALVAAFDNRWSMNALNRLTMVSDGKPITSTDSDNDEVNHWRHAMGNLNLEHKLGDARTLRMDVDYLGYRNSNPTVYLNTSTDVASGERTLERMTSGKTTPLHIIVAKADYAETRGKWHLGTGLKAAFSRFTNETSFDSPTQRDWVPEAGFGSTSRLREDVLAVYGSADFTPSQATQLKTGLRYELTTSNLGSGEARNLVDRRFGSLFPSIAISHKLGEERQVDASYTRRITRPSFRDMAPFLYFLDPQTFFSGNVALQPAITNTLKLDGTYRALLASLQYAWEDSTIARFQSRFVPEHKLHVMFPTNFKGTQTATALLTAPRQVNSWWRTQNNAMLMWQEVAGHRNGAPVTLSSTSYRLNSTHNLTLPRGFALEGSGFYQSALLFGAIEFGAVWQVNVALQKTLRNDAKLTLSMSDVFDSAKWRWTTGSPGDPLYIEQFLDFSRQSVSLAYSTRFGGNKSTGPRATASEDERRRAQ